MSFHDIYGHEKKIENIQKALIQQRIAHAYLFSGIQAIGKRTLAREFIKAINCEKSDTLNDSCNECDSCRKIDRESHPDVFFVESKNQLIKGEFIESQFIRIEPFAKFKSK